MIDINRFYSMNRDKSYLRQVQRKQLALSQELEEVNALILRLQKQITERQAQLNQE